MGRQPAATMKPDMTILNALKSNLKTARTPQMRKFCTERLQDYIRSCAPKEEPKRQPDWDRFIPGEFDSEKKNPKKPLAKIWK